MAPNTIDQPWRHSFLSLLLIINMLSSTLKVLIYLKGKPISNAAHTTSANGINIDNIGKDSFTVSIMDTAPTNA